VRRGAGAVLGTTSACTSTSSGRQPSSTGATTEPGTPGWRSARNNALGSGTPTRPASPISNRPSSWVLPKRCLTARSIRRAWWRSPSKASTVSTRCSSTRGPARLPSLVTWPTSTTLTPRALASPTRRWAQPRTWPTVPGAVPRSGSNTVWIESTTTTAGARASRWATIRGSEVSATSHSDGAVTPRRSARSATWRADSSAVTYRQVAPRATEARAWSSSVDLPTPGSPPTTVTEPGTSPPPSTRSSSGSPVGTGSVASPIASAMGMGTEGAMLVPAGSSTSSTSEPLASHAGHQPIHLGASAPHSLQR
jgi:hypothetical protein